MEAAKKPFPWSLAFIFGILVVICFFLLKYCGNKPQTVVINTKPADTAFIIAKARAEQYTVDSLERAKESEQDDLTLIKLRDDNDLLTGQLLISERKIKRLIDQVGKTDTVSADCEDLADEAKRLIALNEDQRIKQFEIDQANEIKIKRLDSINAACETDRTDVYKDLATIKATYDQLKAQNKPQKLKVFAGISGVYNVITQGAGPVLMVNTPKDKLYGVSYLITNGKPMYQAQALFKISFRKK